MNKYLTIGFLTIAIFGVVAVAAGGVYAFGGGGNYPSIIEKLVEKFGLNPDEVQAVFDEARQERQAQMQAQMQNRFQEQLNQAVTDGKITSEQMELILAKRAELQEQGMQNRQEMQQWAEENGINMMMFGSMGKMGFGDRGMRKGGCPRMGELTE